MSSQSLHKTYAAKALQKLSGLAVQSSIVLELALCHGAVVIVAYRVDHGQRGAVRPNDIAVYLADAVREELQMREDWFDQDIAIFITEAAANHTLDEEEFAPGLVISVNGSARALAQKLHLLREPLPPEATDVRDAEFLLSKISVSNPGQIKYIYARAFPDTPISDHAQELIQRAFHSRSLLKV